MQKLITYRHDYNRPITCFSSNKKSLVARSRCLFPLTQNFNILVYVTDLLNVLPLSPSFSFFKIVPATDRNLVQFGPFMYYPSPQAGCNCLYHHQKKHCGVAKHQDATASFTQLGRLQIGHYVKIKENIYLSVHLFIKESLQDLQIYSQAMLLSQVSPQNHKMYCFKMDFVECKCTKQLQ